MPPPAFSRINIPQQYKYHLLPQTPPNKASYKQNSGLALIDGHLAHQSISAGKFCPEVEKNTFTVPTSPPLILEPLDSVTEALRLCVDRLRPFFQDRPITTRRALFNNYLNRHGPGDVTGVGNWRQLFRWALPYVAYVFRSGAFRDSYVVLGLDPRRDKKWARYQTVSVNLRGSRKSNVSKTVDELWKGRFNHLFTGKEVYNFAVFYSLADIVDPQLKKFLDESPLLDSYHVRAFFDGVLTG
jgi:general transcription factor 3C polypeptide 5 (transcription factor C subunit 1)